MRPFQKSVRLMFPREEKSPTSLLLFSQITIWDGFDFPSILYLQLDWVFGWTPQSTFFSADSLHHLPYVS